MRCFFVHGKLLTVATSPSITNAGPHAQQATPVVRMERRRNGDILRLMQPSAVLVDGHIDRTIDQSRLVDRSVDRVVYPWIDSDDCGWQPTQL